MPTYTVNRPNMELPRVIVAASPAAAIKHVADSELTVRRIEVDEAFELAAKGITLERAGPEIVPPLTQQEAPETEEEPEPEPETDTDAPTGTDYDRLREEREERARLQAEDDALRGEVQ